MNTDQAKALRAEFDLSLIGKLPKVSCGACTQAAKNASRAADKHCDRHQVIQCQVCKAFITTGHIHLDYVGHAATTDRLLQVDPEWSWEPMGFNPDGTPAIDRDGNLWIRLTVAGVTRPGVGDGASMKEKVGDAIRNAAMRFGVALDLWAREDLHANETVPDAGPDPLAEARERVWVLAVKRWPKDTGDMLTGYLNEHRINVSDPAALHALADEWEAEAQK